MNYRKIDTNKFMTLENTVDLLVDAVNQHYDVDRVLADFGIKILGRVNYTSEIPGYVTGQYYGKFGDGYLVSHNGDGIAPFDVYIWTRLSATAVEPNGYWLDIGFLSTIGPQGPQGIQGPEGPAGQSSRWYVSSSVPLGNYKQGDMLLLTNGDVYSYGTSGWGNPVANIKGTAGPTGASGFTPYIENGYWFVNGVNTNVRAEGKAGANGTPGTAIIIVGKRDSVDDLPPAATQPRNHGYLISVNNVVRLYFIAGVEGEESWEYIDYSGNGTIVTTDRTAVDTWETDTKVDKITDPNKIYATDYNGNLTSYGYSYGAVANTIPLRSGNGNISVAETPMSDISAASKKYVDTTADTKVSKITTPSSIYIVDANGNQSSLQYSAAAINETLAMRNSNGEISVSTPTADDSAANKAYVDEVVGNKVTRLTSDGTEKVYTMNTSGEDIGLSLSSQATPNTIAKRDSAGSIIVPTPTFNNQAASKQYVDTAIANSGGTGGGSGENLDEYINQAVATATANKVTKLTNDGTEKVYTMNTSGEDTSIPVVTRATANSILKCDQYGRLLNSEGSSYTTEVYVDSVSNRVWDMYKKIDLSGGDYQEIYPYEFPSGTFNDNLYSYQMTFYAPLGFTSVYPIQFVGENNSNNVTDNDYYGVSPIHYGGETKLITFTCYRYGQSDDLYMIGQQGEWYKGNRFILSNSNNTELYISLLWNSR